MPAPAENGTQWRLKDSERRLDRLETIVTTVPVLQRDVSAMREDLHELRAELRATRKALWTLTATIVMAAIGFAFAVLGGAAP